MKQFNKLAHAVWQCKYHVVWCPKYRFKILKGEIGKSVRDIIKQLAEWRGIPPKYSVAETIGFLKGKSAIKIFDMHTELKRRYWGRHFWAKGYCVSTIGLDEDQIREYVRKQMHKDQSLEQLKLW